MILKCTMQHVLIDILTILKLHVLKKNCSKYWVQNPHFEILSRFVHPLKLVSPLIRFLHLQILI